jgi:hypothetical protein
MEWSVFEDAISHNATFIFARDVILPLTSDHSQIYVVLKRDTCSAK